jgi:hypothetical protein
MRLEWEGTLHFLIHKTYEIDKNDMDQEDVAIQCILIVLHEATQGKNNLEELAELCIRHGEGRHSIPLIEKVHTPRIITIR